MRRNLLPACAAFLLVPSFASAQQADAKLDLAGLTTMLKGLGYEPEKASETSQRITIEKDKFTFRLNFSISGNTKKVWISSYLIDIPDLAKAPPSALTGVLLANGDIGPAHYYLVKAGEKNWLKVGYALDNRNITPAYLRAELDWFLDRIADTAPVWEKAKWAPAG